jgi:hypothetical protein
MDLSLAQGNGDSLRISDYRHRQNLVVLFTGEAGFGCLSGLITALSARYAEFKAEEAEILVVVAPSAGSQAGLEAGLPFPVVTLQRVGSDGEHLAGPSVTVLDRYGEVYAKYRPGGGDAPPSADELLEWLRFIELQCPE